MWMNTTGMMRTKNKQRAVGMVRTGCILMCIVVQVKDTKATDWNWHKSNHNAKVWTSWYKEEGTEMVKGSQKH